MSHVSNDIRRAVRTGLTKTDRSVVRLSLVVPCFNEEHSISVFLKEVVPVLLRIADTYEIVFIDDGSLDGTLGALYAAALTTEGIRVLSLSRNFGKEAALSAGLQVASGNVVVPIDVDLQDPPEVMERFIEQWKDGADVVIGVRSDRTTDSFGKRFFAQKFYGVFNSISDVKIPVNGGDYRLMDRRVIDVINAMPERSRFMKGLFNWAGFEIRQVEFVRVSRRVGDGKWGSWRLWNFALDGIFSFSTAPLRVWTYFGFVVALVALVYMFFLLLRTLVYGVDLPGYASVAVLLLFSLALNLLSIGIIGEYIGRIFTEVKNRPLFIVAGDSGEQGMASGNVGFEGLKSGEHIDGST